MPTQDLKKCSRANTRLRGASVALLTVSSLVALVAAYVLLRDDLSGAPQHRAPEPEAQGAPLQKAIELMEDARLKMLRNDYGSAEGMLREATALAPLNATAHNHLGLTLRKQGRLYEALKQYERALQLRPGYVEAMNNLAVTLEAGGMKKDAEDIYLSIFKTSPENAQAHLNYALMLEADHRVDDALAHYYAFMALSQDNDLRDKVTTRIRALR